MVALSVTIVEDCQFRIADHALFLISQERLMLWNNGLNNCNPEREIRGFQRAMLFERSEDHGMGDDRSLGTLTVSALQKLQPSFHTVYHCPPGKRVTQSCFISRKCETRPRQ